MNRDEATELTARWVKAVATGADSAWDSLLATDVIDLSSGVPQIGSATFRQRARGVRAAFDGVSVRVEDLLVDGDRIAWRWRFEGVHTGAFAGVKATNKLVFFTGVNIQTINAGKVILHWTLADIAGAMRQIKS